MRRVGGRIVNDARISTKIIGRNYTVQEDPFS